MEPLPYSLQSLLPSEDPTTSIALLILLFGKYSLDFYCVYSSVLSPLVRKTKKACDRYEQKYYRGEWGEEEARLPGFKCTFHHFLARDWTFLASFLICKEGTIWSPTLWNCGEDQISRCTYSACETHSSTEYWHNARTVLRSCPGSMVRGETPWSRRAQGLICLSITGGRALSYCFLGSKKKKKRPQAGSHFIFDIWDQDMFSSYLSQTLLSAHFNVWTA